MKVQGGPSSTWPQDAAQLLEALDKAQTTTNPFDATELAESLSLEAGQVLKRADHQMGPVCGTIRDKLTRLEIYADALERGVPPLAARAWAYIRWAFERLALD